MQGGEKWEETAEKLCGYFKKLSKSCTSIPACFVFSSKTKDKKLSSTNEGTEKVITLKK
ncbi:MULTISPECIES: hypothetical protein [unclassified Bacillus cereus group]|uniref:hypothetical protein n=1 Tax=unclassified Bacillus cereus group TaxID=2750818 RepID=UPI0037BFBAF4